MQKPQKTTLLTDILKYGTYKVLIALSVNKTESIEKIQVCRGEIPS